jgi:hypothetical protein
MVQQTDQPYVLANDNPLNATDPLGQCGGWFGLVCSGFDASRHFVASNSGAIGFVLGVTALTLATGGGALIVEAGVMTANSVAIASLATGFAGTYLDVNSCANDRSALACAGMALGTLSGGSGLAAFVGDTSTPPDLLATQAVSKSTAATISVLSGGVGSVVDLTNLLSGGPARSRHSPTPVHKRRRRM